MGAGLQKVFKKESDNVEALLWGPVSLLILL